MITWAEIILLALRLINAVIGQIDRSKWVQSGIDSEIARESQAILAKTATGKAILEKINGMSDAEVDDALRGLEPR